MLLEVSDSGATSSGPSDSSYQTMVPHVEWSGMALKAVDHLKAALEARLNQSFLMSYNLKYNVMDAQSFEEG